MALNHVTDGAKRKIEDFLNRNTTIFDEDKVRIGLKSILTDHYDELYKKQLTWIKPKVNVDFVQSKDKPGLLVTIQVKVERYNNPTEDIFQFTVWPKNFKEICH